MLSTREVELYFGAVGPPLSPLSSLRLADYFRLPSISKVCDFRSTLFFYLPSRRLLRPPTLITIPGGYTPTVFTTTSSSSISIHRPIFDPDFPFKTKPSDTNLSRHANPYQKCRSRLSPSWLLPAAWPLPCPLPSRRPLSPSVNGVDAGASAPQPTTVPSPPLRS